MTIESPVWSVRVHPNARTSVFSNEQQASAYAAHRPDAVVQPLYTEAQVKAREAAAWEAGREASAGVAGQAHMVPPDGGSPTEDERAVAVAAEKAIRTLVNPHLPDTQQMLSAPSTTRTREMSDAVSQPFRSRV